MKQAIGDSKEERGTNETRNAKTKKEMTKEKQLKLDI